MLNFVTSTIHTGAFEGRGALASARSWRFSDGETFLTLGAGSSTPRDAPPRPAEPFR